MRISTTTLESFRLFVQPDNEWMTEQSLLDTILGKFVQTQQVRLGKAYGLVLEQPDRYRVKGGYHCEDYSFDDADVAPALALIDRRGVFEAKAVKAYGPVDVVAVADHLFGLHLSEFKTTASFNFDKYADSVQWRFMADIFEPAIITYRVFELDDHDNGVATLKGMHNFNLFPYVGMQAECAALLARFCDYVTAKGLDVVLRERQRAAA